VGKTPNQYQRKLIKKKITNLYETLNLLDEKLNKLESNGSKGHSVDDILTIASLYESLSNEVYFLRQNENIPIENIEDKVLNISQRIQFLKKAEKEKISFYAEVTYKYRRLWRDHGQLFILSLFCFAMSIILGWAITYQFPEYAGIFFPEHHLEDMVTGNQWFDKIKSNPFVSGIQIAWNNIRVCFMAYVFGIFFGIGGLYILIFNGAMVGVLIGASHQYAFSDNINGFISSHGPLELTLIVASCFASFIYGQSFYKRPFSGLLKRIKHTLKESLYILIPLSSWLCVAACFEVFVSPFDYISDQSKLMAGIAISAVFWAWTFWPIPETLTDE